MKIKHLLGLEEETISGGRYFLVNLILPLLVPIVSGVLSGLMPLVFLWFVPQSTSDALATASFSILFLIGSLLAVYVLVRTTRKRLRTIGISSNWFWLLFIPLINLFFFLFISITRAKSVPTV